MEPFTPPGKAVAMASPTSRPRPAPITKTGKKTPEGIGRETAMAVNTNYREGEREKKEGALTICIILLNLFVSTLIVLVRGQ